MNCYYYPLLGVIVPPHNALGYRETRIEGASFEINKDVQVSCIDNYPVNSTFPICGRKLSQHASTAVVHKDIPVFDIAFGGKTWFLGCEGIFSFDALVMFTAALGEPPAFLPWILLSHFYSAGVPFELCVRCSYLSQRYATWTINLLRTSCERNARHRFPEPRLKTKIQRSKGRLFLIQ